MKQLDLYVSEGRTGVEAVMCVLGVNTSFPDPAVTPVADIRGASPVRRPVAETPAQVSAPAPAGNSA